MLTIACLVAWSCWTTPTKTVVKVAEPVTIEQRIEKSAVKYGLDLPIALKIAECESGLNQFDEKGRVLRGVQNPRDVGIYQINEKYHLENSKKMGLDIYTISGNIEYAHRLMKKEGTMPWNWSKDCWSK